MEGMHGALERYLPEPLLCAIGPMPDALCELRLRINAPPELVTPEGRREGRGLVTQELLKKTLDALTRHSMYAREEELKQGYFTMERGCRVGVCGRFVVAGEQMVAPTQIGSLCIRIAREVKDAAAEAIGHLYADGAPLSALVLSPPGLGKTTMLRDIARRFSEGGLHVALADERCELAACASGVPTMDLGPRCDVLDACPKRIAIMQLIRSMSPEVIVTDELGHAEDAQAVLEAARCGVRVVASAHARDLADALAREGLRTLIESGTFDRILVLGGRIGRIERVLDGRTRGKVS